MDPSDLPDTHDAFLGGQVHLRQAANGFRAGMDSVVLAAALAAPETGRVLEIGCGAGAALLCAARLNPGLSFVGVERHGPEAQRAQENAAANGLCDRVRIVAGDPLSLPETDLGPSFDAGLCNPPFNARGRAPNAARAHAHIDQFGLSDWVNAYANRLTGGAALVMIHRAEALGALLAALEGRLGGVRVRPVQPFADQPARRVLVLARKGSRAALSLLAPLVLHKAGAKHTPQAEALLRGEARLGWD